MNTKLTLNITFPVSIEITKASNSDLYVARCLELDMTSTGKFPKDAQKNLREDIQVYFEAGLELGSWK